MNTSTTYKFEKLLEFKNLIKTKMNYEFNNDELLFKAITHSSLKNDFNSKIIHDNEKLEFIGDAVLDLIISNFLLSFLEYSKNEGDLSVNRSKLVNKESLYKLAQIIDLNKYILVSKSGNKLLIQNNPAVLADSFEALVGAIYLDSDFSCVEKVFINSFEKDLISILKNNERNFKGLINEYVLKNSLQLPIYKISNIIGPDHNRLYETQLFINGKVISKGIDKSVKKSEQIAAKKALEILEVNSYE